MENSIIPDNLCRVSFEQLWASLQKLSKKDKEIVVHNYWKGLTFIQRESLTFEQIEAGLFVIEQSGDTMKIDVPEGFQPREW